jgi:hypothetical protein
MSKKKPAAEPVFMPDPIGVGAPQTVEEQPRLEDRALLALRAGDMLEYRRLLELHLARSLGQVRGGIVQPE